MSDPKRWGVLALSRRYGINKSAVSKTLKRMKEATKEPVDKVSV